MTAAAGNGWNGDAAKELCERIDGTRREIEAELRGEEFDGEPKSQVARTPEELLRQIGVTQSSQRATEATEKNDFREGTSPG